MVIVGVPRNSQAGCESSDGVRGIVAGGSKWYDEGNRVTTWREDDFSLSKALSNMYKPTRANMTWASASANDMYLGSANKHTSSE